MNKVYALLLVAAGIMAVAAGTSLAQDIEEPVLDMPQSETTAPADAATTTGESVAPEGEGTTAPAPGETYSDETPAPAPADSTSATGMTVPAPVVVEVGTSGDVLIRGIAESVRPDELTLKSWGGTWTVRTNPSTTVIPGSAGDLSGIEVGDFVGVDGTISIEEPFVVDATLVRDWTKSPYAGSGEVSVTPALMLMLQSSPASISSGVQPGSTGSSSLTSDRLTELLNSLSNNTIVTTNGADEDDSGDSAEEADDHQEDDTGDASDDDRNEEDEDDTDASDEDQDASDDDESAEDEEDSEEEETDTWRGTASEIGTVSFTLTDGNDEFTVEIDDDTVIVDEDDEDLPLFQLDEDSEVRVEGVLNDEDDEDIIEAIRVEVE